MNLRFVGKTYKNCGASGGQEASLSADMAFQKMALQTYQKNVTNADAMLGQINDQVSAITEKGLGQPGWTPEEEAARNGQVINQTAAQNKQLEQEIGENAAIHSGGGPGLETGGTEEAKATASADVLNNETNALQKNTAENYDQGNQDYFKALGVQEGVPGAIASADTAAGSTVNAADNSTGQQADQNAAANSSWMGLVGGLAGDALGGWAKGGFNT